MHNFDELNKRLQRLCEEQSVVFIGLVKLSKEPDFPRFLSWIEQGKNASMGFLANNTHCREDPRKLLETPEQSLVPPELSTKLSAETSEAKTAVVIALNYYQGDQGKNPADDEPPRIAQYARLKDYHKLLKKRSTIIAEKLSEELQQEIPFRVVTDSAPILERALAARSGSGFIGKNTCYIDSDHGSWLLLSEIILDLKLEIPDQKEILANKRSEQGGCGSCTRCQTHCPTGALENDYQLDARKCVSYYSIEHRETVPLEFWHAFQNYLFGCDICQSVCPYNRKAITQKNLPIKIPETPNLYEIATMDQEYYVKTFGGSPTTRAKKFGLQRNALICMAVRNDPKVDQVIEQLTEHSSLMLKETCTQAKQYLAKINS